MEGKKSHGARLAALTLGAIGVVFGDIGTSPLYTLKECLHAAGGAHPARADLFGVLSLIFWALTMVVTVKYLMFIMRADNKGEGGIFALLALVPEHLRTARPGGIKPVALLAVAGASLLYGDGVITPAISVISAVEGLAVADPDWAHAVVPLSCAILVVLFALQSRGTGTVGKLFGPIMTLWFVTIAALGAYHLTYDPEILAAASPHYAWDYFARHGWQGIHILGSVVLAVTGGEALYADIGHFGVRPIRVGWIGLVFPSLVLAYFGQGAHVLRNPASAANPFFSMVPPGAPTIALVILSSIAAVIASQALISGAFSLSRQAMQLGYFPRVKVKHTARHVEGQIYIPEVNFAIGLGSILLVVLFRESSRLAAAYGIAVSGTMAITSLIYYLVTRYTWNWPRAKALPILMLFLAMDLPFVFANLAKFTHGGYISILIAAVVLFIMWIWNRGRTLLAYRAQTRFSSWDSALELVNGLVAARVPGTAVFLSSTPGTVPNSLVRHVERTRSLHENVVLLNVCTAAHPTVSDEERYTVQRLANGFWVVEAKFGFMERPRAVPVLLKAAAEAGIPFHADDVTYYLGRENFLASAAGHMGPITESIFSFLQRNSLAADRYFGLPPRQVVELGTQLDL